MLVCAATEHMSFFAAGDGPMSVRRWLPGIVAGGIVNIR